MSGFLPVFSINLAHSKCSMNILNECINDELIIFMNSVIQRSKKKNQGKPYHNSQQRLDEAKVKLL